MSQTGWPETLITIKIVCKPCHWISFFYLHCFLPVSFDVTDSKLPKCPGVQMLSSTHEQGVTYMIIGLWQDSCAASLEKAESYYNFLNFCWVSFRTS